MNTTTLPRHQMRLTDVLDGLANVEEDQVIEGLTINSKQVKPGDLFIAYQGSRADGHAFIQEAITAGAVAVLIEKERQYDVCDYPVPVIALDGLKEKIGVIASHFYHQPSRHINTVGVTGTNGKTTVAFLISEVLYLLEQGNASIGTLGYGIYPELIAAKRTTPDAITLQHLLANWRDSVEHIVMEVSSHALDQGRVNGTQFTIAILTNLSRDHLDYHQNMAAYALAKKRLFMFPDLRYAVINLDDGFGQDLAQELSSTGNCTLFAYTLDHAVYQQYQDAMQIVLGEIKEASPICTVIQLTSPWGITQIETPLIGEFNVRNILSSLSALCLLGLTFEQVVEQIGKIHHIPGRLEQYKQAGQPTLVIDYAHTPDALEQVLGTLKAQCTGHLIVIFGCGGNRDKGKRASMGRIAECLADRVILTNDNPRFEEPRAIIEDILVGINNKKKVQVEVDRSKAITNAFHHAGGEDVILIAGKGHEAYQEIAGKRYPFCDRKLASLLVGM